MEQIEPGTGLSGLGLDSLLAMELRARLNTELGTALPVVALLSNAPVTELVAQLYAGLAELIEDDGTGSRRGRGRAVRGRVAAPADA